MSGDEIVIVGAGRTKFGEFFDKDLGDLIVEAGLSALGDEFNRDEIDRFHIASFVSEVDEKQGNWGAYLTERLGINAVIRRGEAACASGGDAFQSAVESLGDSKYVLVGGVEKSTGSNVGEANMRAAGPMDRRVGCSFIGLNSEILQGYAKRFGYLKDGYVTKLDEKLRRQLSISQVISHYHASHNPNAQLGFQTTVEKVSNSDFVAEPLRLYDCCPASDGASAVIITTEREAKKRLPEDEIVYVKGWGIANDSISLHRRTDLWRQKATTLATERALRRVGIEWDDLYAGLGVFEIHNAFSIQDLLALEDTYIATRGKAGDLFEEVFLHGPKNHYVIETDKTRFVPNPGGGLKDGHPVGATGIRQIAECYEQLTSQSKYPVEETLGEIPKYALAQSIGGVGSTVTMTILESYYDN